MKITDQERARIVTSPEGLRNRIHHVEKMARCAFMATESPQIDQYVRDSIGAAIDHVVAELMEIVNDMDTAAGTTRADRRAEAGI